MQHPCCGCCNSDLALFGFGAAMVQFLRQSLESGCTLLIFAVENVPPPGRIGAKHRKLLQWSTLDDRAFNTVMCLLSQMRKSLKRPRGALCSTAAPECPPLGCCDSDLMLVGFVWPWCIFYQMSLVHLSASLQNCWQVPGHCHLLTDTTSTSACQTSLTSLHNARGTGFSM